ncbi:MAG: MaoC family dehydratase N-terminal domain-containing protein [Deltaproteobacteria bacterium]|nr:MaoC family dehydratase N-terminal domain-containing protein [Deltaproteobacteria bacterium]
MTDEESDPLRERLEVYIGKSLGGSEPTLAPDDVNLPMIRHWVDEEFAAKSRFGGIVAPPAMLQAWTMPRPKIEGIAERGAPDEISTDNPVSVLSEAGYVATLATNSELEFVRYLKPGDRVQSSIEMESISNRKKTALGLGYFVTWVTTYTDADGELVGRQLFRIFKFDPATIGATP